MRKLSASWILLILGSSARSDATIPDELKPGLIGEYFAFERALEDFPTIAADKKPTFRKVDKAFNWKAVHGKFNDTDLEKHFYVRWTGILRIPKDETYTFFTESDDGSRLWVAGQIVVENGGLHSMVEKDGNIKLNAGDHEFRVDLYQNEGAVGLKIRWETIGVAKEIIPAAALLHKIDTDLDKPKE
jgi:hypothetical protein